MNDTRFEQLYQLTSIVSLVFQITGTALIALLSTIVSRAVRRRQMQYWAFGWACYTAALLAVLFAFQAPHLWGQKEFLFAYFFLEYAAAFLIFAGCRNTVTDQPLSAAWRLAFIPAALLAAGLALLPLQFNVTFVAHTAVIGALWAACLIALWPAVRRPDAGPGVRIVAAGLGLLSLDYFQHLVTPMIFPSVGFASNPYYYTIVSLIDGMLEFVLGFGTVVVIVDKVRGDLERANWQLKLAHDRSQDALHMDELTSVFSRYSFNATFVDAKAPVERGCIVVVDLDNLKHVNDTYGHAAGDAAIRSVASALGSMVRHEDRVYRFGGDEFVVVLPDMHASLLRDRMARVDDAVNRYAERERPGIGPLSVSWGVAEFGAGVAIESALAAADSGMYAAKSARKAAVRPS